MINLKLTFTISINFLAMTSPGVLSQEVMRGSAAFIIDGGGNVTAASVSAAVGQGDAYSRSFYDPMTGNLSSFALGSINAIQCDGSPCNHPGLVTVELGFDSGIALIDNDPVPRVVITEP